MTTESRGRMGQWAGHLGHSTRRRPLLSRVPAARDAGFGPRLEPRSMRKAAGDVPSHRLNARPKLASESQPAPSATSAIVASLDRKAPVALFIRHRVTYEKGDSPTSALNRVANAVRDIATCRAKRPTSQRASGWRWMDTMAAPIRGSRRAAASPRFGVPGAEKYVRSASMNSKSARRVTAISAPGRRASASSDRNASVSRSHVSTPPGVRP